MFVCLCVLRNILQKVILIVHKLPLSSSEDLLRFLNGGVSELNKKCRFEAIQYLDTCSKNVFVIYRTKYRYMKPLPKISV